MFQKLPLKIILNIISHLNFEDKLNLKTTCTKLNELITKEVLYEELDLLDLVYEEQSFEERKKTCDAIIQKLINDKFDGSVVKVLNINIKELSDHLIPQLSDLFPNVRRVIYSKRELQNYDRQIHNRKIIDEMAPILTKWRNTIEKIDSQHDWNALVTDVLYSKYPQLIELDLINASVILSAYKSRPDISLFENAPLLTTLTLRGAKVNFDMLEKIHTGFPLLQSLRLFITEIKQGSNDPLPQSITPANTMSFLGIFNSDGFNKNSVVLDYLLRKYPNLQKLVFSVNLDDDYFIKTRDLFVGGNSWWTTEEEDEQWASTEMTLSKESFPIRSGAESKFFSCLPKSIKALTLKIFNKDNAIKALAESGINLTQLDLIGREISYIQMEDFPWKPMLFVDTDTLEYFKKLPSLKTLKIPLHLPEHFATQEVVSVGITRLYVSLYGTSACIESILSMFPSLEALYIYKQERSSKDPSPECKIMGRNNDEEERMQHVKVYPKLRILSVESTPIHSSIFDFIKVSTPNLEELDFGITLSKSRKSRVYKINLSDSFLNKCNLTFTNENVYCTVIIQNVSKRFMGGNRSNSLTSVNSCREEDRQYVEITADHIKHLKIFGFSILKIGNNIVFDM